MQAFFCLIAILITLVPSVEAAANLPLDLSAMRSLDLRRDLAEGENDFRSVLVSFFQNDCGHCDRQLAELDCLAKVGWRVIAVGIGSERLSLRRQWLRNSKKSAGYWISYEQAKELGVFATPHNFVWLEAKQERHRLQGVISCAHSSSLPH